MRQDSWTQEEAAAANQRYHQQQPLQPHPPQNQQHMQYKRQPVSYQPQAYHSATEEPRKQIGIYQAPADQLQS